MPCFMWGAVHYWRPDLFYSFDFSVVNFIFNQFTNCVYAICDIVKCNSVKYTFNSTFILLDNCVTKSSMATALVQSTTWQFYHLKPSSDNCIFVPILNAAW